MEEFFGCDRRSLLPSAETTMKRKYEHSAETFILRQNPVDSDRQERQKAYVSHLTGNTKITR